MGLTDHGTGVLYEATNEDLQFAKTCSLVTYVYKNKELFWRVMVYYFNHIIVCLKKYTNF